MSTSAEKPVRKPAKAAAPGAARAGAAASNEERYGVGETPAEPWAWAALGLVLAAGAALRLLWISAPVAGYHAFNEAFYLDIVARYREMGLFAPWVAPLDLNNPPLYPFLLRLFSAIPGDAVVLGRLFSVLAALATVAAVFVLGRRLYGSVAGVCAATVTALAPGAVLVGRNIQIDAVSVLFMVLATLAWVAAADRERTGLAASSGVAAGMGVLCKLQAGVVVPALAVAEVARTRRLSSLWSSTSLAAFVAFALSGLSWHAFNAARASGYAASQQRLAEMATMPDAFFFDFYLAREVFWLFSPPLALVAVAALGFLAVRRRAGDVLVLALVGANLLFYLAYHHHTYYLYALVPFVGLAVGASAQAVFAGRTRRAVAAVAVAAVVLALFSATMLLGKKAGYWTSADFAAALRERGGDPSSTVVALTPGFRGSWEPALVRYGEGLRFVSNPLLPTESIAQGERLAALDMAPRPPSADAELVAQVSDRQVSAVFFGFAARQGHDAAFYFAMQDPSLVRVGPLWLFGVEERTVPGPLYLYLLSPEMTERVRASSNQGQ